MINRITLLLFIGLGFSTTINIPSDYSTIQSGIDAASDGDTALVQPGTYYETINYNGKNIVIGSLTLTTKDTSYISQTIIDGNEEGSVVTFNSGEDSTAVLDGFTIQNGSVLESPSDDGGGIYISSSNPTINNVYVSGNTFHDYGGGIYCFQSSSRITNSIIINNEGITEGYSRGGGIAFNESNVIVSNVKIFNNKAYEGSGISIIESNILLFDVKINGNGTADGGNGGGVYIQHHDSSPVFNNVEIIGNTAVSGGGVYCDSGSPEFNNVMIIGNSRNGMFFKENSNPSIINTTISANFTSTSGGNSTFGGGIWLYSFYGNINVVNTIISDNDYYGISFQSGNGNLDIKYSNLFNNDYGDCYNCGETIGISTTINANGDSCDAYYNLQVDPLFVDPENMNYHLTENSSCIDAGDPNFPYDSDSTISDIGAYFYNQAIPVVDFISDVTTGNAPLTVQFTDLTTLGIFQSPIISWSWNFGDGNSSVNVNPAHTYINNGSYNVSLNVTDETGYSAIETKISYIDVGSLFHVSTSGSDDNNGSEENPFATIQKGINSCNSGDTVLVAAGTYVENINYNGKNILK